MCVCMHICMCVDVCIYVHIYDFLKSGPPFPIIFASITNLRQAYSGREKENNGKFKLQLIFFLICNMSHLSIETSMFL